MFGIVVSVLMFSNVAPLVFFVVVAVVFGNFLRGFFRTDFTFVSA